jgi:hypothetical protein
MHTSDVMVRLYPIALSDSERNPDKASAPFAELE